MTKYYAAFAGVDACTWRTPLKASTLTGAKREATVRFGLQYSQQSMIVGILHKEGTPYEHCQAVAWRYNRQGAKWITFEG